MALIYAPDHNHGGSPSYKAAVPHAPARPFGDPPPRSSTAKKQRPPPPPPPSKQSASAPMAPSANSSINDITEAVRDTVVLKSATDSPARAKPHRSATHGPASSGTRPSSKRSQTEDAPITEKSRSGKSRGSATKGSQHADVIDRLDFTGVGPMFHHDGPFDACAPSRNKQRSKAPMYAWGTEELTSPRAYGDSAYPAPGAYKAFSNDYPDPPKKKVDAIAEAWGIHEPEPFEEFFAGGGTGKADADTPASSIYNGRDAHTAPHSRRLKEAENRNRVAARRSIVPPPRPIFAGESQDAEPAPLGSGSPPAFSTAFPKRSKSIMHRIRKMRDAPNVPVGNDYESSLPPSPSSPNDPNRSGHRQQNSFLGRFAANQGQTSPTEPFVFIESTHHNKDLPAPPPVEESGSGSGDYFDQQGGPGTSPTGANGLGRKTSLMKKVGRVVRGSK